MTDMTMRGLPGKGFANLLTVDELAQEIRRVDGNHSLGAGALAEALMPFLTARLASPAPEADARDGARLDWIARQGDEFSSGIIVDAPGDGDYYVSGIGVHDYGTGKTFREALDAAMSLPAQGREE